MDGVATTPEEQRLDRGGRIMTWLAGAIGVVLGVPMLFLGCFGLQVGSAGPIEVGTGVGCHTQACSDELALSGAVSLAYGVVVIALVVLAMRSTPRALATAAALGLTAAGMLVVLGSVGGGSLGSGTAGMLLILAAIPGALGCGSWMRLAARAGREGERER